MIGQEQTIDCGSKATRAKQEGAVDGRVVQACDETFRAVKNYHDGLARRNLTRSNWPIRSVLLVLGVPKVLMSRVYPPP